MRVGRVATLVLAAVLLAGCGASVDASDGAEDGDELTTDEQAGSDGAHGEGAEPDDDPTAAGEDVYVNPVIDDDFPDPDILLVGDTYYAYATNSGSINVRAATSTDLVEWTPAPDALPVLPPWVNPGFTWAPEVTTPVDGSGYRMYVTVRHAESGRQCIAVATADDPGGSFQADTDGPFVCQLDEGGSIDASTIVHDGVQYLVWKNDGNCCGKRTYLYLQELTPDGLALVGEPARILENDRAWEGDLIEAPTLVHHEGRFHLFYSANSYAGAEYAMGHAVANEIHGPYEKSGDGPWVATQEVDDGHVLGPGGQDVVVGPDGRTWLAYHSWDPTVSYRRMNLDVLLWEDGLPVLEPTLAPTERP